ncbi:MAG TPA: type II secretion system protein GspM [Alphaproteobacteria bacterium]|nr:type II secretion system protein GspM [Alphaproteobacteria bacterium]
MIAALGPRQSRALALVLLLLALAAVVAGVVGSLVALRAQGKALSRVEADVAHYAAFAHGRAALESRLMALRRGEVLDASLFNAVTVNQATAALQHLVDDVVSEARAHTDTVEVLPEKSDGPLVRIGERLSMSGDIAAVRRILYRLEAGKPALFADNLRIRINDAQALTTARFDQAKPVQLAVGLELYGYTLAPAQGAAPPL